MTFIGLLLIGAGIAWVCQNPRKTAEWLLSFAKKKESEDNVDKA